MVWGRARVAAGGLHVDRVGRSRRARHLGIFSPAPFRKREQRNSRAVDLFCVCVLALTFSTLLSPYYPWYYSWIALFLCFVPNSAALALTLIAWPLYRSLFERSADDLFRYQSRIFLPFFALLVLMLIMRIRSSRTATKS